MDLGVGIAVHTALLAGSHSLYIRSRRFNFIVTSYIFLCMVIASHSHSLEADQTRTSVRIIIQTGSSRISSLEYHGVYRGFSFRNKPTAPVIKKDGIERANAVVYFTTTPTVTIQTDTPHWLGPLWLFYFVHATIACTTDSQLTDSIHSRTSAPVSVRA